MPVKDYVVNEDKTVSSTVLAAYTPILYLPKNPTPQIVKAGTKEISEVSPMFLHQVLDSLLYLGQLGDVPCEKRIEATLTASRYLATFKQNHAELWDTFNGLLSECQRLLLHASFDTADATLSAAFMAALTRKSSFNGVLEPLPKDTLTEHERLCTLAAEFFFEFVNKRSGGAFFDKLSEHIKNPNSFSAFLRAQKNWLKEMLRQLFFLGIDVLVGASQGLGMEKKYSPQSALYQQVASAIQETDTSVEALNHFINGTLTELYEQASSLNQGGWIDQWMANQGFLLALLGAKTTIQRVGLKLDNFAYAFVGEWGLSKIVVKTLDGREIFLRNPADVLLKASFDPDGNGGGSRSGQSSNPNRDIGSDYDYRHRNPGGDKRYYRMSPEDKRKHEVTISSDGKPQFVDGTPLDGAYILVIDPDGKVYCRQASDSPGPRLDDFDPELDIFKHSSFQAPLRDGMNSKQLRDRGESERVSAAGGMTVYRGVVSSIDNATGHFATTNRQLAAAIYDMATKGGFRFYTDDRRTSNSQIRGQQFDPIDDSRTGWAEVYPNDPVMRDGRIQDISTTGMPLNEFLEAYGYRLTPEQTTGVITDAD